MIAWLERIERAYLTLMVCSSILLSVIGVFYRYFLNSSLSFVEEVAGFMLAGIIVIGSSLAITSREHIRVEVLHKVLPGGRRWLDALSWLGMLALSVLMLVLTARFVHKLLVTNQMSTSLEFMAIGWPLVVMPVGYALCSLKSAWLLAAEIRGTPAGGASEVAQPESGAAPLQEVVR